MNPCLLSSKVGGGYESVASLTAFTAFVYDPLISWRLVQTDPDLIEGRGRWF